MCMAVVGACGIQTASVSANMFVKDGSEDKIPVVCCENVCGACVEACASSTGVGLYSVR
jgi:hypothetical protein